MTKENKPCNYEGAHFGAFYIDATCIDGYLWDLDSGGVDEKGNNYLSSGGHIPCPKCKTEAYLRDVATDLGEGISNNQDNVAIWEQTVTRCKEINPEATETALKSIGSVSLLVDSPSNPDNFDVKVVSYV